jgi:hypothetical protein
MRWFLLVGLAAAAGCKRHPTPAVDPRPNVTAGEGSDPQPTPGVPDWVPPLPTPEGKVAPPPPTVAALDLDGGLELPGDGGTVNGNPKGPKAEALNEVIRSSEPAIQGCLEGAELPTGTTAQVRVSYRIMPDGRPVDVAIAAPPSAVECLKRTVGGMRFPSFEGEPVSGSFPYAYRRQ